MFCALRLFKARLDMVDLQTFTCKTNRPIRKQLQLTTVLWQYTQQKNVKYTTMFCDDEQTVLKGE